MKDLLQIAGGLSLMSVAVVAAAGVALGQYSNPEEAMGFIARLFGL